MVQLPGELEQYWSDELVNHLAICKGIIFITTDMSTHQEQIHLKTENPPEPQTWSNCF
jgi:hypothetical protein